MKSKIVAGTPVWVVGYDEDGVPLDVTGYVFIAEVCGFAVMTPYINDMENIEELLAYHARETASDYETNLAVYPAKDCFTTQEEAQAALDAHWVEL